MARGEFLNARLLGRIADSPLSLTVVYPPAGPVATGVAPVPLPVSPLTGPAPETTIVYADLTSDTVDPVTIPCLWYDRHSISADQFTINSIGWRSDADALAVVAISEAAEDAADPNGDTIFSAALRVEHLGHHYRVLDWEPVGRGFSVPVTYYVWLAGAKKQ